MADEDEIMCDAAEASCELDSEDNGVISLWIRRPHVFNRRLRGAVVSPQCFRLQSRTAASSLLPTISKASSLIGCSLSPATSPTPDHITAGWLKEIEHWINIGDERWNSITLFVRKLIPRQPEVYSPLLEVVLHLQAHTAHQWLFLPIGVVENGHLNAAGCDFTMFSYKLLIDDVESVEGQNSIIFHPHHGFPNGPPGRPALTANLTWLKEVLIPKLNSLCGKELRTNSSMPQSLSLLPLERYNDWYVKLKQRYGDELVKKWPERTDPKKYVFEDIAIAAYLLMYWELEREELATCEKQSFVDLGCGNGLLVYLLAKEGHPGKGIDVRRRKIWDCYSSDVILEESSLHPNIYTAPGCDWLIGNHSDELTPWLPLIAARSSYNCRYFVLPCCFHDFTGKFQRSGPKSSQYETYLSFVQDIGEKCGFVVERDTLRIPSTKRVCHIGKRRTYNETEHHLVDEKLKAMLELRGCTLELVNNDSATCSKDSSSFKPRQSLEPVRNCTRINEGIKTSVINLITKLLLETDNGSSSNAMDFDTLKLSTKNILWKDWIAGGTVAISDIVQRLDSSVLDEMKNQCGGLQTLLRNHSHILKVVKGTVKLRDYRQSNADFSSSRKRKLTSKKDAQNSVCLKTKLCWFFIHHPDGCPLTSELCKFAHGNAELQVLQVKERTKWD